ncbi:MAG: GNAT family N-acetyltransferase [Desulfarculus sp.]|nr:GNAT family N-acetyltransferase [Desulfarculus sp.]
MTSEQATYDGYRPGDLGRVIWLHGDYYHRHWGFDLSFEAQEARELAEFLCRLDPSRDLFLAARLHGQLVGAIALDGAAPEGARLRWFIVDPRAQGRGLGRELIRRTLDFGRWAGHRRVFLWTFEGLTMARRLYEAAGFTLSEERLVPQWGGMVKEQRFDLPLEAPSADSPR